MTRPSWENFGTHDESAFPELWDGVIGAWAPCLGPTGSRLHDISRRANWGTLTNMDNATDWVVSDGQYSLDFDGSNDSVLTGFPTSAVVARQHTVSVWVYHRSFPLVGPGLTVGSGATGFILIGTGSTRSKYELWDNARNPGILGKALTANTWNLLTGRLNAGQMELFVNGKLDVVLNTNDTQNISIPSQSQSAIGHSLGYTHYFDGLIDDAIVWDRALSPNEIQQLYQRGRGGMYQRRRRRAIYLPQAGFQSAWARGSNVLLGFNQP